MQGTVIRSGMTWVCEPEELALEWVITGYPDGTRTMSVTNTSDQMTYTLPIAEGVVVLWDLLETLRGACDDAA